MAGGSTETDTEHADALALSREEMRITFEYQVGRLQEIDSKAVEILKANLLLIGILITGGSILVQTEFDAGAFLNVFTITGGLLLFVSTALAGVTYTASNLRGGLDADAIERAVADHEDGSDAAFEKQLLRSYGRWIEYNAQVTAVNDILVTATVLLVIVSLTYVVGGVTIGVAGVSTLWTLVVFVVFTLPVAWLLRLAYHMDHLGTPREEADVETFSGVRLSKGATRADGVAALRRMLVGPTPPPADSGE